MAAIVVGRGGRGEQQPGGPQAAEGRAEAHARGLGEDPGRDGQQQRLGRRRDGEGAGGGGTDQRAETRQGQPARHPAARLATEQRPGRQAFPERVRGQRQRDHGRAGQRDGGALQETVDREGRRRARAGGSLPVFLAAAPAAGGQARGREDGDRGHRHQDRPDPGGAGVRPRVGEQVQPRDDEQRARSGGEPDLPLPGPHAQDVRPGDWQASVGHRVPSHHRRQLIRRRPGCYPAAGPVVTVRMPAGRAPGRYGGCRAFCGPARLGVAAAGRGRDGRAGCGRAHPAGPHHAGGQPGGVHRLRGDRGQ